MCDHIRRRGAQVRASPTTQLDDGGSDLRMHRRLDDEPSGKGVSALCDQLIRQLVHHALVRRVLCSPEVELMKLSEVILCRPCSRAKGVDETGAQPFWREHVCHGEGPREYRQLVRFELVQATDGSSCKRVEQLRCCLVRGCKCPCRLREFRGRVLACVCDGVRGNVAEEVVCGLPDRGKRPRGGRDLLRFESADLRVHDGGGGGEQRRLRRVLGSRVGPHGVRQLLRLERVHWTSRAQRSCCERVEQIRGRMACRRVRPRRSSELAWTDQTPRRITLHHRRQSVEQRRRRTPSLSIRPRHARDLLGPERIPTHICRS
mmetsp:Transcript_9072/g.19669  ORF Transcript_9072/g.19669 Transcript_9072/m.19669 type:complete len:318 (-) Transcript_9072:432-1385(-)|eukprot:235582-Pleurochrysis_carterae.AAC.2